MVHKTAHQDGEALLASMEKTIPQKVAVCAAHMLINPGDLILDAGCADGQVTAYFALKYPEARFVGVDYDGAYIARAKEQFGHIPNLEFIESDLRKLDMGGRQFDAVMNLSFLHEPFSYTSYRAQTVEEILASELSYLKPGGVIINRDFVLPENPDAMVYLALKDDGQRGDTPETMSLPDLLKLYSREAMRFDAGHPERHIKGFFMEEQTARFQNDGHGIPEGWRVFYLPHQWAWEFGWRAQYKKRFFNEAEEKYAYWTDRQHRDVPERLGARVLYTSHVENPWILENWYEPNLMLFDRDMKRLPLQPSNFISVLERVPPGASIHVGEHRVADQPPSYLERHSFTHIHKGEQYDLVKRPGGDVVDVIPYFIEGDDLMIVAKSGYPRPVMNTYPRQMSPNLDAKTWSGHVVEPFAKVVESDDISIDVRRVLEERAGLDASAIAGPLSPDLIYYTAPSDLNECVSAIHVPVEPAAARDTAAIGNYSNFSTDGLVRVFNAKSLLAAAQAGMMPEARLEANIYELLHRQGKMAGPWIGRQIIVPAEKGVTASPLDTLLTGIKAFKAFTPSTQSAGWLDVVRSEFHDVSLQDGRRSALVRQELEFAVPGHRQGGNMSTNSAMLVCLTRDKDSGEILLGLQKISETQSQFPAVQDRNDYSGHVTIPGFRLPSTVEHAQFVPDWLSETTGLPCAAIKNLGEGYFPSLGVMPNRVFPYVLTEVNDFIASRCDFVPLREVFGRLHELQDLNTMIAVNRAVHALGLWDEYAGVRPVTEAGPIPAR